MSALSTENRKQLGVLLLKLKADPHTGYTSEEWELGQVLESRGLVRYNGPPPLPPGSRMGLREASSRMQMAAMAYYELMGVGRELLMRYTPSELERGNFLLPGEAPWYDRWPWKQWWLPMGAAVVTTILLEILKAQFKH